MMESALSNMKVVHTFCFAGTICHTSAVQWSADNRIAVATEKGVHILKSQCSPIELGFPLPLHKQFICSPKETLNCDVMVDREYLHSFLEKDSLYDLMMDHSLSPFLSSSSSFLGIHSIKWSPDCASGGRCILAVLTMDHRLMLYAEIDGKWTQLDDLSTKLYEHHKSLWHGKTNLAANSPAATKDAEREYIKMKERHHRLAIIAIEWTERFTSVAGNEVQEWCYLIGACRSGHIVFWKVNLPCNNGGELMCEWDSELGPILAVCWQQTTEDAGFLLLGSLSGALLLVPVGMFTSPNGSQSIQLGSPCFLWSEKDRLAVNHAGVLKQSDAADFVIIITKGNFLVGCDISVADGSLIARNVQYESGDHQLPVTGLSKVGKKIPEKELLLTSLDGRLLKITVVISASGVLFNQEEISNELDDTRMCPWGVCNSPNGALCAIVRNTACMYDHLVTREPIQLIICSNLTFDALAHHLSTFISRSANGEQNSFKSLYDIADYLDCLRAYLGTGVTIPPSLQTLLMFSEQELEVHSTPVLQLLRFMLKATLTNATLSDEQTAETDAQFMLVEKLIMKRHIMDIIINCRSPADLKEYQKTSLLLMCDWLFIHYSIMNDDLYSAVGCMQPTDKRRLPAREKCRICGEPVSFQNVQQGECSNHHRFGRCCQSLLLCDGYQYLVCLACQTLACKVSVWNTELRCTFCNTMMSLR